MTNAEMIKALRCCASLDTPCKGLCPYYGVEYCQTKKDLDAADAIEQLNHLVDLNTERCEALRKQLREAHENYEKHLNELEAQLPKEGEWIGVNPMVDTEQCSICGWNIPTYEFESNYCPNCGAKMRYENQTDNV